MREGSKGKFLIKKKNFDRAWSGEKNRGRKETLHR